MTVTAERANELADKYDLTAEQKAQVIQKIVLMKAQETEQQVTA
jgi:hypothetical protein